MTAKKFKYFQGFPGLVRALDSIFRLGRGKLLSRHRTYSDQLDLSPEIFRLPAGLRQFLCTGASSDAVSSSF